METDNFRDQNSSFGLSHPWPVNAPAEARMVFRAGSSRLNWRSGFYGTSLISQNTSDLSLPVLIEYTQGFQSIKYKSVFIRATFHRFKLKIV
jgi:hypothetical protein